MKVVLLIDETDCFLLRSFFDQDTNFNYSNSKERCFLDKQSAEIVWAGEALDDDVNNACAMESAPDRYAELHPMNHDDQHSLLRQFLRSDWTDDAMLKAGAIKAYGAESIGLWKELVAV